MSWAVNSSAHSTLACFIWPVSRTSQPSPGCFVVCGACVSRPRVCQAAPLGSTGPARALTLAESRHSASRAIPLARKAVSPTDSDVQRERGRGGPGLTQRAQELPKPDPAHYRSLQSLRVLRPSPNIISLRCPSTTVMTLPVKGGTGP
jgi:hypothetical protein